jgi:DNA polymerase III subunit epsilon
VLDTLLLSSVLHPNQESHSLEAIAERLGVGVFGRHDAMADALMTAQIFQRMIPLLAAQGIRTLGEARLASHRSKYAQVRY